DKGDQGVKGDKGDKGDQGDTGAGEVYALVDKGSYAVVSAADKLNVYIKGLVTLHVDGNTTEISDIQSLFYIKVSGNAGYGNMNYLFGEIGNPFVFTHLEVENMSQTSYDYNNTYIVELVSMGAGSSTVASFSVPVKLANGAALDVTKDYIRENVQNQIDSANEEITKTNTRITKAEETITTIRNDVASNTGLISNMNETISTAQGDIQKISNRVTTIEDDYTTETEVATIAETKAGEVKTTLQSSINGVADSVTTLEAKVEGVETTVKKIGNPNLLSCADGSGWFTDVTLETEASFDIATQKVQAKNVYSSVVYLVTGQSYCMSYFGAIARLLYLYDKDKKAAYIGSFVKDESEKYGEYFRYYKSFTVSVTGMYSINLYTSSQEIINVWRPKLEIGTAPTLYDTTIQSTIKQTANEIRITAKQITLEGLVTANENFKVLEDGSIEAVNGKFQGVVSARLVYNAACKDYPDGYTLDSQSRYKIDPINAPYSTFYSSAETKYVLPKSSNYIGMELSFYFFVLTRTGYTMTIYPDTGDSLHGMGDGLFMTISSKQVDRKVIVKAFSDGWWVIDEL
ncbi:MAG: hypothetical protein ACI3YZ_06555, partial [Prevotella sp.]